ncbi:ODA11 [Symbiodinium natans]|uniref:ODA11 protein n=1 Tax=Symbiodinium natans TaxID=878477 RepID=A0A812N325_9DINO|nr:ODA11 [Symbiodinium natans]
MACPAGQMWNSGSGAADCVPCPAGHMSYQGGLCLQTLAFMLEHGPTPSFSAQADNYGLLQLSFQVSFGAVYENISMVYSVDVQPDAGSLSAGAVPCDGLFKWTDRQVGTQTFRNSTKTLTYTELDGACKLGTTFEASEVVRSGVAAVFLCRGTLTECQQVIQSWHFPLTLRFPRATHAYYTGLLATEPKVVQNTSVYLGAFPTEFLLYESNFFTKAKDLAIYRAHDRAFAELRLQGGGELDMVVSMAWLSKTTDPKGQSVHNLTDSINRLSSGKGQVRFSVQLEACYNCYLHVLASITNRRLGELRGRKLAAEAQHAVQTIPITVKDVAQEPQEEQEGGSPVVPIVMGLVALLVLCPLLAVCFRKQKRSPSEPAAHDLVPSAPPACPPLPIGVPLQATQPVFQVAPAGVVQLLAAELRKARGLGVGYDQRFKKVDYSSLRLKECWQINLPTRTAEYDFRKYVVQQEVSRVASELFRGHIPCVTTATDGLRKSWSLDTGCNEQLLFHGTGTEHLLSIAYTGVSERLSGGLFGTGAYLAEDAAKADQYAVPLEPSSSEKMAADIRSKLFTDCGLGIPQEDVYFMLVCKVVLGFPLYTQDGETAMASPPTETRLIPGATIFANSRKGELVQVEHLSPPVRYHALIAEKHRLLKRFREFVIYDGKGILPAYIVAYERK